MWTGRVVKTMSIRATNECPDDPFFVALGRSRAVVPGKLTHTHWWWPFRGDLFLQFLPIGNIILR
ncbi:MAG: hypothetical protein BRD30_10400 [Bacteroidetes bacterium QH_2_63_10]|nr:MAG: hypothetical protein BRD30_10400 [Bacteroidetes bacterium QH_2_63_10]